MPYKFHDGLYSFMEGISKSIKKMKRFINFSIDRYIVRCRNQLNHFSFIEIWYHNLTWLSFFIEYTFNILPWYFCVHLWMFNLDALDFFAWNSSNYRENKFDMRSTKNFLQSMFSRRIDTSISGNNRFKNLNHSCGNNYKTYLCVACYSIIEFNDSIM